MDLPLHRLERIFAREGIDLARTTLSGWVADFATALTPIGDQLRREITAATYLQTDDTSVTVLDDRAGSFKGRLWTYLDPLGRQVVFEVTATHERDGPERFLAEFRGALQADAYAGYDGLYQSGRIREIGCWAHARRRFVEALMTDPQAALMVARIQQLYQVEHAGADLDPDARRVLRREQAVPLLTQIDGVRQELARTVLPKSPLGDAVRYLTNQWTVLQRFVEDAGSPSTITAPRTSFASSRSVGRTGCLRAAWKAPIAPRSSIHSSRAASWSMSRRSTT
jgi:transposase